MTGRSFMKQASTAQDDDKFTRNDAPRTRPRPSRSATTPATTTTMREKADPNATPRRHRMSVTSTLLALRHPREWRSRLPAAFNIARFVIYGAVLIWTAVCLAVAVRFQQVLQASDLTTFVPFAIFVSIASIIIFVTLLTFTLWKREANPISTRIELGCLGLAGTLWIALGAFMATSDAEVAEVECYASENDTEPVSLPGFTTDTFHAQYHVLEAFSLFNAVLIWGFLIFAFFLALRHHRRGSTDIWYQPVTALPWSGQGVKDELPNPVVHRGKSVNSPAVTPAAKEYSKGGDYFGRSANTSGAATPWTAGATPGMTPRADQNYARTWMPTMFKNSTSGPVVKPPPTAAAAAHNKPITAQPRPRANRYNSAPLQRGDGPSGSGSSQTPLFNKNRRDGSPQRGDSQRSAADRWARGVSPERTPVRRDTSRSAREPQRRDTSRSGRDVQRHESSRSERREPTRGDSTRIQRTESSSRRELQRTGSSRDPQRTDSSRREPRRTGSSREPERTDSSRRNPQRTDSSRRDPQRMDSSRSERRDRWGRDASPRR